MADHSKRKKTGYRTPDQGAEGRAANEARVRAQFLGRREIIVATMTELGMEVSVARSTLERMTQDGKLQVRTCRNGNSGTNFYSLPLSHMLRELWIVRDKGKFLGQHFQ